jgi:hypothetical protein
MTERDFCFWLQGYFEIGNFHDGSAIGPDQCKIIRQHLRGVFFKPVPPLGVPLGSFQGMGLAAGQSSPDLSSAVTC